MPRLATVNRERAVTVVEEIIFSGTPSQVVNLPAYLKGVVGAIIVFAAFLYAATRWPVPWYALLIALVVIAASVVLAYLRTPARKSSSTPRELPAVRAFSAGGSRALSSSASRM
ncbi:hypothetical protein BN2476_1340010 [Paraburkholderia piptadeniae]|uniref:Uncharacterized protein n=1 Tax=Paraburkholderia piptadeniae TaxID=1701573 RepID=A0A1N7SWI7_9BURK|nr:hypothetical protein BN2476_1340010 [Paraburkholderia piptadeniae]